MKVSPSISNCSIVLVGQFNPAIFHPAWLQAKGIETEGMSTDTNTLITAELANFSIHDRSYHIRTDRFQIDTLIAPWVTLLDITTKIFAENLHHTPIMGFGINRSGHVELPSKPSRIKLGRKLAPTDPWGDFGERMETEETFLTGGLRSLVMQRNSIVNKNVFERN